MMHWAPTEATHPGEADLTYANSLHSAENPPRTIPSGHRSTLADNATLLSRLTDPGEVAYDLLRLFTATLCNGLEFEGDIPPGPRIFISNHQSSFDLGLLAAWLAALRLEPISAVAWTGFRYRPTGDFLTRLLSHPANRGRAEDLVNIRVVESYIPADVLALLQVVEDDIIRKGVSVIFAGDGMTQSYDGEPVTGLSSVAIDMALRTGVDIYPVRFMWGLPARPQVEKPCLPYRLRPQHAVIGAAISASALASAAPLARRNLILEGINRLHKPLPAEVEARNEGLYERVVAICAATGLTRAKVMICDLLVMADPESLSRDGRLLRRTLLNVEHIRHFDYHSWLYEFYLWLTDGQLYGSAVVSKFYPDASKDP